MFQPRDQLISRIDSFKKALRQIIEYAEKGKLVFEFHAETRIETGSVFRFNSCFGYKMTLLFNFSVELFQVFLNR